MSERWSTYTTREWESKDVAKTRKQLPEGDQTEEEDLRWKMIRKEAERIWDSDMNHAKHFSFLLFLFIKPVCQTEEDLYDMSPKHRADIGSLIPCPKDLSVGETGNEEPQKSVSFLTQWDSMRQAAHRHFAADLLSSSLSYSLLRTWCAFSRPAEQANR